MRPLFLVMRLLSPTLDTVRLARLRSTLQFAAATMVIWTLLALLSIAQTAIYLRDRAQEVRWDQLVLTRFVDWYTCALFLPILFWLARRWPLERGRLARTVPLHLAASALCVLAKYAIYLPLARWSYGASLTYRSLLASNALSELVIFWAVIGIIHAVEFYRRYQEGRLVSTQLEAELASARLEALAAQLRPHFLFNTIGAVSELMHQDTIAADRMLNGLAELLRQSLSRRASHDVPLREE